MPESPTPAALDLADVSGRTLNHYQTSATSFWAGTKDHDVTQNTTALLRALEGNAPLSILDFGCGPGRDLAFFRSLGHEAVGLEGCEAFVQMAREHTGCEVWHQDFLALRLPPERFDGIFANASLFHVPRQRLRHVLSTLHQSLKPRGVLFSSNPRGNDQEGWNGNRYGCYFSYETWREELLACGFEEVEHYYRPAGLPREQQPWLASVWRKVG